MANVDITSFLLTKIGEFDPSLDVSVGSAVHQQVVAPLMARLGVDPLSTDIRSFLLARLRAEYPDLDAESSGSALDALLLGPLQLLLEPFRQEISWVRGGQSLARPDLLTTEDAQALLANVFSSLQEGSLARGVARVYYPERRTVVVDGTTTVTSVEGYRYYATRAFVLTADQMSLQVEGSFYYVDVDVEAEAAGPAYRIEANRLVSAEGLPGYTRVTNRLPFQGGAPTETVTEAAQRARDGLGERSPATDGGVRAVLMERLSDLRAVRVIGYGDPEMTRDVITGTATLDETRLGLGPLVLSGTAETCPAVNLASADAAGPALTYLTLPGRTNRLVDTDAPFTAAHATAGIHVKGEDRGVSAHVSATEILVDDFAVVAKGTAGMTTAVVVNQVPLPYADTLTDLTTDFLGLGVATGDWLRVRGTWAATAALPTNGNINAPTAGYGPGNTQTSYFQVTAVHASGVVCARVSDAVDRTGRHTAAAPNGCNIVSVSRTVVLNPSSTVLFTDEPAVLPGDFVTLYKGEEPGLVAAQEWEVLSVADRVLTLVVGATPTNSQESGSDGYKVRWAVRRAAAGAKARLLLAGSLANEWAILRLRAGIDPATYAWLETSDEDLPYSIRSRVRLADVAGSVRLTVSDVPVGVTFPVSLGRAIDVSATDQVHIGGCTDAYVHQATTTARAVDLVGVRDSTPVVSGTDLACVAGSSVVSSARLAAAPAEAGDVLVITSGEYVGAYRVHAADAGAARLDTSFANAFSGVRFYVTRRSTVALDAPRVTRLSGSTLTTYFQSTRVQDSSADFVEAGVEVGDVLHVLAGLNAAKFQVAAVVSPTELDLATPTPVNAAAQSYTVYKALSAISRPFRRLTAVDVLSPAGDLSGVVIPPSEPVDIRSTQFANVGRGALLSGSDMYIGGYSTGYWYAYATDTQFTLWVNRGDVLRVRSGPNMGTYPVLYAFTNFLVLDGRHPLRAAFPSPRVQVVYDGSAGAYTIGESVTFGVIEAHDADSKTLTILLTGLVPAVGQSIVGVSSTVSRDVASYVPDLNYEVGPPSIGSARAYFTSPTMLDVRNLGGRAGTAVFSDADGRQYVPSAAVAHTYLDLTAAGGDQLLLDAVLILPVTSITGTWAGLEFNSAVKLVSGGTTVGGIVRVTDSEIWVRYTSGAVPTDGAAIRNLSSTATAVVVGNPTPIADVLITPSQDLQAWGAESGDLVAPVTVPLVCGVVLMAGGDLSGRVLTLKVAGVVQSVTFSGNNPIPLTQASPSSGLVQQINLGFSGVTARVDRTGQFLELHSAAEIVVQACTALAYLGLTEGQTNATANTVSGGYRIYEVLGPHHAQLMAPGAVYAAASLAYEIGTKLTVQRPGAQRISAKEMSANVDETGLYYVDLELQSVEPGDGANIADKTRLTVLGHTSLGYRLESRNPALTFSPIEQVDMRFTPAVQDPDLDDGPDSYQIVEGRDLRITYDYDDQVATAQTILVRDEDRVVCNNPLAKSMRPAYYRTAVTFSGGTAKAALVEQDIRAEVDGTAPTVSTEVSKIHSLLRRRGATRVPGPIEILAVCHNGDRSVTTERSYDRLSVGRTAKLIADVVKVTKG